MRQDAVVTKKALKGSPGVLSAVAKVRVPDACVSSVYCVIRNKRKHRAKVTGDGIEILDIVALDMNRAGIVMGYRGLGGGLEGIGGMNGEKSKKWQLPCRVVQQVKSRCCLPLS